MKKYYLAGVLVLCLLLVAVSLPTGTSKNETKHFENDEISLDYPATWEIVSASGSQMVSFKDPETGLEVRLNRQLPFGNWKSSNYAINLSDMNKAGVTLVSQKSIDWNGTPAQENVYLFQKDNKTVNSREIWMEKNGVIYSLMFVYPDQKSDSPLSFGESQNLKEIESQEDLVLNTLQFKNFNKPNQTSWGKIIIPSQEVSWDLRSDTVNAANGIYHYPESSFPGQNGTIGFLGHHTSYSAPFANINLLKNGETVEIIDYLSQKKYIYEVTANGDINWEYRTNPVQFPAGVDELKLVTCWPPGRMDGAWIVTLKLVSVQPLL